MYNLLTKCIYKKYRKRDYNLLFDFRDFMLSDNRTISVIDFGAGSRVFKSPLRRVSQIAKNAGISKKRAVLLNKITSYFNFQTALELGTSVGISSVAIAANNPVQLISLEGCPETARTAKEGFKQFDLSNIRLKVGEFESNIDAIIKEKSLSQNNTFDLIYFDGNHQKEPTLHYFNKLLPLAHNDSVFIFDDIHWSKEMEEAWEEIKLNPKVKVSIDAFFWGLIFFRKEQEKEHFALRL
ncbi:O-methyltransferase [Gillisia lutea]|uniref:O-methyltransferase n=1 Tax=Gillisia lutea TaxID=2909668 RepID=UPI0027E4ABFA|nr:class I SAM-dependent methyltransferase [Gillisia lutea]